jgi:hypothetical protein
MISLTPFQNRRKRISNVGTIMLFRFIIKTKDMYKLTGFVKGNPILEKDGNFYIPTLVCNVKPVDENLKKLKQIMRLAWRYEPYGGRELPIFDEDHIEALSNLKEFPDPDTLVVEKVELINPSEKLEKIQNYLLKMAKKT